MKLEKTEEWSVKGPIQLSICTCALCPQSLAVCSQLVLIKECHDLHKPHSKSKY